MKGEKKGEGRRIEERRIEKVGKRGGEEKKSKREGKRRADKGGE